MIQQNMRETYLISVVIPTYRRPALLARCLDALYVQSFPSNYFEIIVISDGPDTDTHHVINTYMLKMRHLKYVALPTRSGPATARNVGWQKATAKLVVFTDDDCIPQATWLQYFYDAYSSNAQTYVAFTGRTIVPLPKTPTDYERNISNLEHAEFITANCACTKEALKKTGGFDEHFARAWREDSDLQFTFLQYNIPIVQVNAVVIHPVREAAWGISLKEEKKGMYDALLYKKYPQLYRKKIQSQPPWRYYLMILSFFAFVVGMLISLPWVAATGLMIWILLWAHFTWMRLATTSHALRHVSEMMITSSLIPFLSIYWRWYGAIKYKTPLF
jgi:glycosyltransferase involved in cell wall biosynthesis